ncbi:MAG TPA: hypothetical protein VK659_03915 [Asanoa sp.]|nr:hypothetical protein [Asanoa sp.]
MRDSGALLRHIAGADPFYPAGGFGGRCLIGFNARAGSTYYFLTSRHCVGRVAAMIGRTRPRPRRPEGTVARR